MERLQFDQELSNLPGDFIDYGTCNQLVEFVSQVIAKKEFYEIVYNAALTKAIAKGASAFIKDMLAHEEVVSYLDHSSLYIYANEQDYDFQKQAIEAMVNFPPQTNCLDLQQIFDSSATNLFNHPKEQQRNQLIRIIFDSENIEPNNKIPFLRKWILACVHASSLELRIFDLFFDYLPRETIYTQILLDQLIEICCEKNSSVLAEQVFMRFLNRYSFSTNQIMQILESEGAVELCSEKILIQLLKQIDDSHPEYGNYQLILKFLSIEDPKLRSGFFVNNQPLFLTTTISACLQTYLLKLFSYKSDEEFFINWFIDHPDFAFGPYFTRNLHKHNLDLLIRSLNTSHLPLPNRSLFFICQKYADQDPVDLISILIQRQDHSFDSEDLFKSLLMLFNAEAKQSLALLLKHPSVFDLLKRYYELEGDKKLGYFDAGALMPAVLAWYLALSNQGKEIFLTIPKQEYANLLCDCVPPFIDSNQPTLRGLIFHSGVPELVAAIGGYYKHLISITPSAKPTIFMPSIWQNPKKLQPLRILQQNMAVKFAHKKSKAIPRLPPIENNIKEQAVLIARNFSTTHHATKGFYLQHQTTCRQATSILAEGRLKSGLHIQGHSISGKSSGGLINQLIPIEHSDRLFSYFLRIPEQGITVIKETPRDEQARFVLNGVELLKDNPQLSFLLVGFYSNARIPQNILKLPSGHLINSDPESFNKNEGMIAIALNTSSNPMLNIYEELFTLALNRFIEPLDPSSKFLILENLIKPKTEEDYKLARDLIDLLYLEWLMPGDVPLKLSYVEKIEFGEETYNLSELRTIALEAEEKDVLAAINQFSSIDQFPFVVNGMIKIALERRQKTVVKTLYQIQHPQLPASYDITYYPEELYQCASLAQLILEDFNNERVFAHYDGQKLTIHSTLKKDNRDGAHYAEMAILYHALKLRSFAGENALQIVLDDILDLPLGQDQTFQTLLQVRDALLAHEIKTLLVCAQNLNYYRTHEGAFHPITGKGASNGTVALSTEKLFIGDLPFDIHLTETSGKITLTPTLAEAIPFVVSSLSELLSIPLEKIKIEDCTIRLSLSPQTLIAILRKKAICYEGINVFDNEGRLFLAERKGKGLASAGGHHSEKYTHNITYGLYSEFALTFKNPSCFDQDVIFLKEIRALSKTGIYIVAAEALCPAKFHADHEEFVPDSEMALALTEMRGKIFYDVMPLPELCEYLLSVFKKCLQETYPEANSAMSLKIDKSLSLKEYEGVTYQIPEASFGTIKIVTNKDLPSLLEDFLRQHSRVIEEQRTQWVYFLEENPIWLSEKLTQQLQASTSLRT